MDYHYETRHYGGIGNNRPSQRNERNPYIKLKTDSKSWDISDEENYPSPMRCHRLNLDEEEASYSNSGSYHRLNKKCHNYDVDDSSDYNGNTSSRSQHTLHLSRRNSNTSQASDEIRQHKSMPNFSQNPERQGTLKKTRKCKFCADSDGTCLCPIHLPTVRSRYMRVFMDNNQNAVTINVFKNGENRETPTMIHISKFHMCSIDDIMKVIDKFVRFPVGYAYALYTLLGDLVEDPMELEQYDTYVVVNNIKKKFVHMEYGSKKPTAIYMSRCRRIPRSSTYNLVSKYPLRK